MEGLLLIALGSLLLYALLTRAVLHEWQPLLEWDGAWKQRLHEHGRFHPQLVALFRAFTTLSNTDMLFFEAALVTTVLAVRRHWRLAFVWFTAIFGGYFLVEALKAVVDRPRPFFPDPFVFTSTGSFPSGHASGAVLVFGLQAYLVARFWPKWRYVSFACCGAIILTMGFSRLYLGAHWFSDVLGGFLLALAWDLMAIAGMKFIPRSVAVSDAAPANTPATAPLR
ncbi:MAG TPA: phosphatase PAP2 family protein [Gemmataceae bacterium]|jgi:undecaprenyl-diphosphatase|nr:phosphatase PAP2 family protein [Gemmataceae bacterium]